MRLFITLLATFFLLAAISSCSSEKGKVTNATDYDPYLSSTEDISLLVRQSDLRFWEQKIQESPNESPFYAKAASSHSALYNFTGNIEHLKMAEEDWLEANLKTNFSKASYLRGLAQNYMVQHRFREAFVLLKKAEESGENLIATQRMLFDVHLQLEDETSAKEYLAKIENELSYDYFIRLAQYKDAQDDLDGAIEALESALEIAKFSDKPLVLQSIYINLGNYYGRSHQIDYAYKSYLKALEIDPNDSHAKKGIAWIVYANDNNPKEALRILNTIIEGNASPEYFLLKAEIAEYIGDNATKEESEALYLALVEDEQYGAMYNPYKIELFANEKIHIEDAIKLAKQEISEHPTAQSYDLLAWAFYNNHEYDKALEITEHHVIGYTHEPKAMLHSAFILKANGKEKKAQELKEELSEETYELGPLTSRAITKI